MFGSSSTPIIISASSQTENLRPGDLVTCRGRTFTWSEHHLKESELESVWRRDADFYADHALAALPSVASTATCPTSAPFDLIRHHILSTPPSECHPAILAFWEDINRLPPTPVGSSLEAERELVTHGQFVYTTYMAPINTGLLYYSLAGGFSFAKITRVLELTSYLVDSRQTVENDGLNGAGSRTAPPPPPSASGGRRLERLVETSQWILAQGLGDWDAITPPQPHSDAVKAADASNSPTHLPGPGEAWMDTIKVRLLHAQIRARVMGRVASGAYDLEKDGVPLNTEDLCATLAAFSVAPIWCLDTMDIPLSHHEREAYLALWRHLGFYLGVPARVLHSHFGTYERANAFFESAIAHLFSFDEDPATIARLPTVPVLRTVAARGGLSNARAAPKPHEFEEGYHFALAHALIGSELAVSVGLPPPSLRNRWRVRRKFWEMRLPIVFGRLYPRRAWEAKRLEIIRRAVPRMMIRLLGNRRSTFFAGPPAGVSPRAGDVRWIKVDANTLEWAQGSEWIMRTVAEQGKEMMSVIGGATLFTALLSGVAWKLMY